MLPFLQWQVEPAQAEGRLFIGKRQGLRHALPVDLHPQDPEIGVQAAEARGAFQGGPGVEAVAQVDEQGLGKRAIHPRQERGLVKQDKIVHPAQAVGSGLASGRQAFRFFGSTRVWHKVILYGSGTYCTPF